jgi:hypothetical protein
MTKNLRPLAAITADIYKAERQNIFTIGKLLREAKAHFPHGKWLPYLKSIDWSERTAQFYMSVVELADKYETVADLGAAPTALYQLVGIAEKRLPLAIVRLGKSVERKDTAAQQREAVALSIYGDEDTTELALQAASDALNQNCFGIPERLKAMEAQFAAIIKANPKAEEELKAIIDAHPIPLPAEAKPLPVMTEDADEEDMTDEGADTEPEPTINPRQAALIESMESACETLKQLSAKPSATFLTSEFSADELDMLGNFLKQIAASKRNADPIVTPALSQPAATPTPSATESAVATQTDAV